MEKEYTSDDGLKLLEIGGIELESNEKPMFIEQFNKIYKSSSRYYSFVGTVWDIYSQILLFKAYPNRSGQENYFEHLDRDDIFRKKIIDSGIDEQLRKGVSLDNLVVVSIGKN